MSLVHVTEMNMDCYDKTKRSKVMREVHATDTSPELFVRKMLFEAGFRYRLHDEKLPGRPDIILPKYKIVIFVNGCFWHRHPGCPRSTMPASNKDYWEKKFLRNIERDKKVTQQLENAGWQVHIIWECEKEKSTPLLIKKLIRSKNRIDHI